MVQAVEGDDFAAVMTEFVEEAEESLKMVLSTEKQMKDEFEKVIVCGIRCF